YDSGIGISFASGQEQSLGLLITIQINPPIRIRRSMRTAVILLQIAYSREPNIQFFRRCIYGPYKISYTSRRLLQRCAVACGR
ncbi:hypothetical protein Golomagni_04972, partial [Golovinomyces magnicellulatus]